MVRKEAAIIETNWNADWVDAELFLLGSLQLSVLQAHFSVINIFLHPSSGNPAVFNTVSEEHVVTTIPPVVTFEHLSKLDPQSVCDADVPVPT